MQSPSHPLRALVTRIVTFAMLSVVVFTAAVATGLAGGTAAHASTQTYTITDLGTLGYNTTVGFGINANGQIVGKSWLKRPSLQLGARLVISVTPTSTTRSCGAMAR